MLTLMANTSRTDAVWCLIEVPVLIGNFPIYMSHAPFVLPPNDGVMHDLLIYGPVGSSIDIGHLYGTYGALNTPNPVDHLHVKGCLGAPGTLDGDNVALKSGSWTNLGRVAPSDLASPVYSYTGYLHPSGRYWTYDRNANPIRRANTTFTNPVAACPSLCQPLVTPLPSGSTQLSSAMEYYAPITNLSWDYAHHIYTLNSAFTSKTRYVDYRRRRYFTKASQKGPPYWYETKEYSTSFVFIGIRGNTSGTWTLRANFQRVSRTYAFEGTSSQTMNVVEDAGTIDLTLKAVYPGRAKVISDIDTSQLVKHLYETRLLAKRMYRDEEAKAARNSALSNGFGLSSNELENASQLSGSLSVFKDLLKGYEAVQTGDIVGALKAISGAYLWYSYAVAPGISDFQEVVDKTDGLVQQMTSVSAFSNERQRGAYSPPSSNWIWTTAYYCTIHSKLNINCFAAMWNALSRIGFQPTPGQAWDFVPFSFVVDWFLNVGPILRQIEAYLNMKYVRDVVAVIETYSVKWSVPLSQMKELTTWEVLGAYTEILYERHVSSQLGDFDPLAGQSTSGLSLSQMAQGASLLIQQLD